MTSLLTRLVTDEQGQDLDRVRVADRDGCGGGTAGNSGARRRDQFGLQGVGHENARPLGATGSGGKLMQFRHDDSGHGHFSSRSIACVFDLRTRRIPNALTFGAALAALVFHRLIGRHRGRDGRGRRMGGWPLSVPAVLCHARHGWRRREASGRTGCMARTRASVVAGHLHGHCRRRPGRVDRGSPTAT